MQSLEHLNEAMANLEQHLADTIDFQTVARIACCPEPHFRRMFSFLSGMPLGEYVRRRRLSEAALDLQAGTKKILDIALKYGYDSPDSFTRAFCAFHGVTPRDARSGACVKTFAPMSFQLCIKGGEEMQYRLEEKQAFQIVGVKKRIPLVYRGVNEHMQELFARFTEQDFVDLKELCDMEPKGILCVSANFEEGRGEGTMLDQYIGVATTQNAPSKWDALPVEAGTWAVFSAVGRFPDALQDIWARIYAQWFPSSGYVSTGGPEMLWNQSRDTSLMDYRSEIFIPVRKG